MTEWTREKRYSVLKSADELRELYDRVSGCKYRQRFHVQPITGLLNDPNGFMRTNDGWHLFYQWCPWGAVHGLKYWYHVFSKDLVHWKNIGVALKPDTLYDNKGVYSGCALVDGSRKFLFYTGNHRTAEWKRIPYTCLAEIKDDAIEKFPEPLFTPSQDYTEHQRDPKVVFDASSDCYYLLLGAQTKQLKGRIIVYKSVCPDRHWQFAGELEIPATPFEGVIAQRVENNSGDIFDMFFYMLFSEYRIVACHCILICIIRGL